MQLHITQLILVVSLLDISVQTSVHKKRSPLELGYVSFTQIPSNNYKHNSHNGDKHAAAIVSGKSSSTLHPKDVWVPGHVSHHAYIPAHHVIVHQPLLVTTHSLHFFDDDPFRRTYGGFGVGLGVGGHGHGHGYHVVFN